MIGFIGNELLCLRSYLLRQMGLILLASIAISIGIRNFGIMPIAFITCFMLTMVSCFTVDECAKWNSFALTLPVNHRDIIRAKYIVFLGGLVLVSLASGLLAAGFSTLLFQANGKELVLISGGFCALFIPASCICLPLFIHLGVEKAHLWMILVFLTPFFIFLIAMQRHDFAAALFGSKFPFSLTQGQILLGPALLVAVLAVCIFVSYKISLTLYQAKEF